MEMGRRSEGSLGLATETKQAFKTTEFWAMVGLIVAILVSAAVINGGDNGTDEFIARQAWLYVSILGAGYFISRGLAKSGSREPYRRRDRPGAARPPRRRRQSVVDVPLHQAAGQAGAGPLHARLPGDVPPALDRPDGADQHPDSHPLTRRRNQIDEHLELESH